MASIRVARAQATLLRKPTNHRSEGLKQAECAPGGWNCSSSRSSDHSGHPSFIFGEEGFQFQFQSSSSRSSGHWGGGGSRSRSSSSDHSGHPSLGRTGSSSRSSSRSSGHSGDPSLGRGGSSFISRSSSSSRSGSMPTCSSMTTLQYLWQRHKIFFFSGGGGGVQFQIQC